MVQQTVDKALIAHLRGALPKAVAEGVRENFATGVVPAVEKATQVGVRCCLSGCVGGVLSLWVCGWSSTSMGVWVLYITSLGEVVPVWLGELLHASLSVGAVFPLWFRCFLSGCVGEVLPL